MLGLGLTLWPNRGPAGTGGGGGYRFWRIFILNNNGHSNYTSLNEVELRGSVGGPDLTSTTTPVVASTFLNGTYDPKYTVDNSLIEISPWVSYLNAVTNQWLRYDLGTPTAIAQVAMCWSAASVAGAGTGPKDLRIEGSNDGTNFTTVKTFLGNTSWPAGGVFKVFNL